MPQDWYTVPPEYGGRSLPFHRRLYYEWLWRSHGEAGLQRIVADAFDRIARNVAKVAASFDRLGVACRDSSSVLGDVRRMIEANKDDEIVGDACREWLIVNDREEDRWEN